ncbi:MAG: hypothetical protein HY777_03995 [Betaproteobacteria bacterium]|nr:hypothetical protein [Betaproteobacteria bacterium]
MSVFHPFGGFSIIPAVTFQTTFFRQLGSNGPQTLAVARFSSNYPHESAQASPYPGISNQLPPFNFQLADTSYSASSKE